MVFCAIVEILINMRFSSAILLCLCIIFHEYMCRFLLFTEFWCFATRFSNVKFGCHIDRTMSFVINDLELNSVYYFPTNKQIFPVCRILVFFAMRLSYCETCIGVNEWLEQDSFKFIMYCFPRMCRFLLFAMRLGSHCGIWLSHECVEFCCFAQRLSSKNY